MPRTRHTLTRRALLIGGAAVIVTAGATGAAVENGLLPGRNTMYRVLGLDGPAGTIPASAPGPMVSGTFTSKARLGASCGWAVSYPPGSTPGSKLPVVIALHGYSGDHRSAFGHDLGLDHFLAQAVHRGSAPFAIASVDGGNTYWHRRSSGEDAGAMVMEEFIPLLHERGLATDRVGLMGLSMGGYGALLIAGELGSGRVAAVSAESPAIWHTAAEAAHIAFDSPAQFAAFSLFARQSQLAGIPVRVDCGTGDGFYPTVRDYIGTLRPKPSGGFSAGGHDEAYWRRMAPDQLAFLGSHLV